MGATEAVEGAEEAVGDLIEVEEEGSVEEEGVDLAVAEVVLIEGEEVALIEEAEEVVSEETPLQEEAPA